MELQAQGEEKESEEQQSESAQGVSLLMDLLLQHGCLKQMGRFLSHLTKEVAASGASLMLNSSVLKLLLCLSGTWDSSSHLRHLRGYVNKIRHCSSAAHQFCWA